MFWTAAVFWAAVLDMAGLPRGLSIPEPPGRLHESLLMAAILGFSVQFKKLPTSPALGQEHSQVGYTRGRSPGKLSTQLRAWVARTENSLAPES